MTNHSTETIWMTESILAKLDGYVGEFIMIHARSLRGLGWQRVDCECEVSDSAHNVESRIYDKAFTENRSLGS